jgi:hypothetical protein
MFVELGGDERRFAFSPGSPLPRSLTGQLDARVTRGTVTALRISSLKALDSPLEMLVSF